MKKKEMTKILNIIIVMILSMMTVSEPAKPTETEPEMTYLGNYMTTAYTWTGNPCANGNYPTDGYTIACNSLDFGTKVYIEGVGERIVEDRGPGSMPGAWLDIYMDSYDVCVQWGVQYRDVYIIEE